VPQPLRAFRRQQQLEDLEKVERIVSEVEPPAVSSGVTAGGDVERLRGLPAVSRHTRGAVFGTDRSGGCS
jgi:hypothetical protein